MKVMLMVNLKIAKGKVIPKGAIFTDEYKPFPGFIQRKIGTPLVQVLEDKIKYEVVDVDDFTMEAPEPKQEEVMIEVDRYVEPVEEIKALEEEEVEPEQEEEIEEPVQEEEVEQEEKIKPVRKRRTRKKKDTSDEEPKKRRGRKKKVD